jgi:hypothetical protein
VQKSFYLLVIISTPNQRFKLQNVVSFSAVRDRHEVNVTTTW